MRLKRGGTNFAFDYCVYIDQGLLSVLFILNAKKKGNENKKTQANPLRRQEFLQRHVFLVMQTVNQDQDRPLKRPRSSNGWASNVTERPLLLHRTGILCFW